MTIKSENIKDVLKRKSLNREGIRINSKGLKIRRIKMSKGSKLIRLNNQYKNKGLFSFRNFIKHKAHIGHLKKQRNPFLSNYILGYRNGSDIINIEKSYPLLLRAIRFMKDIIKNKNGTILFVVSPSDHNNSFENLAKQLGQSSIKGKWVGGLLTNHDTIVNSRKSLVGLKKALTFTKNFNVKHKKVASDYNKSKYLADVFRNIVLKKKPDAIFICDLPNSTYAFNEALRLDIPIIAFVDTNCSPSRIDYPILTNDDSHQVFTFYARLISHFMFNNKNK